MMQGCFEKAKESRIARGMIWTGKTTSGKNERPPTSGIRRLVVRASEGELQEVQNSSLAE
jgi:hypothetical protein